MTRESDVQRSGSRDHLTCSHRRAQAEAELESVVHRRNGMRPGCRERSSVVSVGSAEEAHRGTTDVGFASMRQKSWSAHGAGSGSHRDSSMRKGTLGGQVGGAALLVAAVMGGMVLAVHGGQVVDVDSGPVLPFMMNMTNPFHPSKSLSFAHVLFLGFSLTYADTAGLRGYIGQDVTQLGRYYAKTKFGCITHCDSSDFTGIDGILGLGMPDAALASIPEPLFFALSDETGDPANQYILNRRIFTLVGTDSAAELHLGGFDPHSTKQDMKYIRTTSPAEYSVPVSSISLGGHEFLNFASAAQAAGRTSIPGILDSGTSCLVVPDSTLSGLFLESPYTRIMENLKRGEVSVCK